MSTVMYNKIYEFLTTAEERQINATSVIYLGMKRNRWVSQTELKTIVEQTVSSASNVFVEGSSRQLRIFRILPQFDNAFEGVCSLYDMGALKTDKEQPLSSDQIEKNINELKRKLGKDTSPLYQHLYSGVSKIPIQELTWKDPLASQVISDKSELVNQLPGNFKKGFMKLARNMTPKPMPLVQEMCRKFIQDFNKHGREIRPRLSHDGTWKESEEDISCIVKEVLNVLKDVWNNPAFDSEVAGTLNEGTYQSTVIVSAIRASLKNFPIDTSFFISTSEKQSIASADRKGEGNSGRRPDIMFVGKYREKIFELMYIECSRLICSLQKKTDDEIKLWRETNDGMYWVLQSLKPDKDQFGIVSVQVAGDILHLNILVRDKVNVHRYYHLQSAEIPIQLSNESVVTKFVETLLLLRNLLITNLSLLYHATISTSQRQKEDSSTVSTPMRDDDYN